jgi:hypothetical protein
MIHNQNLKVVAHTSGPQVVGSTATVTLVVDRMGYDQVSLLVTKSAVAAATSFASVLKVEESDLEASAYSDVTALVKGGTGGFTMAAVSTSVSSVVKMDVDCVAKKRYLRLTVTPDATATVSAIALLSRGEEYPSSAALAGVDALVKG